MPLTWIALTVVGALLGWLASVASHRDSAGAVLSLIALGVIGGLVGALTIAPYFTGHLERTGFSLPGLLLSLAGSILLIAVGHLVLRRAAR